MYKLLLLIPIVAMALSGPVLAASAKCIFTITNCVIDDPDTGRLDVLTYDGSDGFPLLPYTMKHMGEKGESITAGCTENVCDTAIFADQGSSSSSREDNDACEHLWVVGSSKALTLMTIETSGTVGVCDE